MEMPKPAEVLKQFLVNGGIQRSNLLVGGGLSLHAAGACKCPLSPKVFVGWESRRNPRVVGEEQMLSGSALHLFPASNMKVLGK